MAEENEEIVEEDLDQFEEQVEEAEGDQTEKRVEEAEDNQAEKQAEESEGDQEQSEEGVASDPIDDLKAAKLKSLDGLPDGMSIAITAKDAKALGLEVDDDCPDWRNCSFKVAKIKQACGG